jgi:hypothetical protein
MDKVALKNLKKILALVDDWNSKYELPVRYYEQVIGMKLELLAGDTGLSVPVKSLKLF